MLDWIVRSTAEVWEVTSTIFLHGVLRTWRWIRDDEGAPSKYRESDLR